MLRSRRRTQLAELDGRLDVEQMHAFGAQAREEPFRLVRADRHHNLDGLVGQLEEARRMDAPVMAEAFDAGHHSGAGQAHFLR